MFFYLLKGHDGQRQFARKHVLWLLLKKNIQYSKKKPKQSEQGAELINAKFMCCFNAELRRQAEGEVQTLRASKTEEARIIREQNTWHCPERRD